MPLNTQISIEYFKKFLLSGSASPSSSPASPALSPMTPDEFNEEEWPQFGASGEQLVLVQKLQPVETAHQGRETLSTMPNEVIVMIARNLVNEPKDIISFGSACRSTHYALGGEHRKLWYDVLYHVFKPNRRPKFNARPTGEDYYKRVVDILIGQGDRPRCRKCLSIHHLKDVVIGGLYHSTYCNVCRGKLFLPLPVVMESFPHIVVPPSCIAKMSAKNRKISPTTMKRVMLKHLERLAAEQDDLPRELLDRKPKTIHECTTQEKQRYYQIAISSIKQVYLNAYFREYGIATKCTNPWKRINELCLSKPAAPGKKGVTPNNRLEKCLKTSIFEIMNDYHEMGGLTEDLRRKNFRRNCVSFVRKYRSAFEKSECEGCGKKAVAAEAKKREQAAHAIAKAAAMDLGLDKENVVPGNGMMDLNYY